MALANEAHSIENPKTLTFSRILNEADGSMRTSELLLKTWAKNGSTASNSFITSVQTGDVRHSGIIRDTEALEHYQNFNYLGVTLVEAIPEQLSHAQHRSIEECRERMDDFGTSVNGNEFVRESVEDGNVTVRKYDPDLGCDLVEFTTTASDGTVLSSQKIIDSVDGVDDSLFAIGPSLKKVTRAELLDAYRERFGRDMIPASVADKLRQLDSTRPTILDD